MMALGWALTVAILGGYALTVRRGSATPFHVVNVVTFLPMAAVNASVGAWPAVTMNLVFGVLAVVGLVRG